MDSELTLMAVHAHPDDEVLGTGGIFARYAEEGIRTVLVTCTNGEQGDGPDGVKPGDPGHDETAVRERRLAELRDSVAHLGIQHVELLGYRDSGMAGWDANGDKDVRQRPVEEAAARLGVLMENTARRSWSPTTRTARTATRTTSRRTASRSRRRRTFRQAAFRSKFYYTAVPRGRSSAG